MKRYRYNELESKIMEQSEVPFAVFQLVDKRVVTILMSKGFMDMFGFDDRDLACEVLDNDMYWAAHPDDIARVADAALRFAEDGEEYNVIFRAKINGEYRIIHSIGKHIWPEEGVRLGMVWYVDEGAYVGTESLHEDSLTHDFSVSLYESSLHRKTNYDFLTGLPNMTYFFELARASRLSFHEENLNCSLIFANLNGMKNYNKKYGFSEGNELLRNVANILIKYFGSEKCCRIGQDNFAFVAPTEGLEEALNDIFKEIEDITGERAISIRVGIYPDTMGMVETSIACDRARYACNTLRKSNVSTFAYYDEDMLEYEDARQYVIDNLDKAIEENWLQAYYQPIIRTANGRVSDEEALARWIDPEKGMMSPAEFIPVLEDSKLIYKLDLHMVDQIIEKMRTQAEKGLYVVPVSVNLSRNDFDSCDIVEEICKRIDAANIPREKLTIEITESVVGSDFDFIKSQVERFQSLGFRVWMDDFGSGYSSLDVLQSIHFDLIKFDMRFMKQFHDNEKTRIILTELMKMALSLGTETVTEGVETAEQVEFLREIGCTKLQGYYFCRPISQVNVLERYERRLQIGFENPEESEYYDAIGKLNLYDMDIVIGDNNGLLNVNENPEIVSQFFNTIPMSIIESDSEEMKVIRCNKAYRDFLGRAFGNLELDVGLLYESLYNSTAGTFARELRRISDEGGKTFITENIGDNVKVHSFIRRISVNPVTGVSACAVAVLGIVKDSSDRTTYSDIANSLSSDYLHLYYVNLETEDFIEYSPDSKSENLTVERHGKDFFASSRRDAREYLYSGDSERFISEFYKENVLKTIDEYGKFTITYRLLVNGEPLYVNMKAIRMSKDKNHIIIGVNNVDAQTRQQEALERMREEHITYARISALSGNYLAIYTVNPETDEFEEYGANSGYEKLDIDSHGKDFFNVALSDSRRIIYKEDQEQFEAVFTKENVMRMVRETGVFMHYYRIVIDGKPIYVSLRIAMVEEKDGPKLIVGVCNIDAQVRRDQEYEK